MAHIATKTVNPLQLVAGSALRNNLCIVRFKEGAVPAAAPVREALACLRRTVPAGTAYLLFSSSEAILTECPEADFSMEDMQAFEVNVSTELVAAPAATGAMRASAGIH